MKTLVASLESISPISFSKEKDNSYPKLEKESARDHEKRTWRERCHYNDDGIIYIPPMAFKNCLSEAAKFLAIKIPGEGKKTWSKHFESGVLILDGISLGIHKNDVEGEWFFVPSNGKRGGGTRVWKCFPVVRSWKGDLTIYVLDDMITDDVFKYHLEQAGMFIGLCRFRPSKNGFYGRFKVLNVKRVG